LTGHLARLAEIGRNEVDLGQHGVKLIASSRKFELCRLPDEAGGGVDRAQLPR
jgi:hypothetical protein